jgi:N-methylhydantoinase A
LDQGVLIGIDVGGTFTDAVAVHSGNVVATAKEVTEAEDLARSLLSALDSVLTGVAHAHHVARLCLSTTLITNLLAQRRTPEVATLLVPGPGRDPTTYHLPGPSWIVGGMVDFRGRERVPLDRAEVNAALKEIHATGVRHLAVVGKFSPRNPRHEEQVLDWARQLDPTWHLHAGHTASGQLNFPRRAAATATMLAVEESSHAFFTQLQDALARRGLTCPIVILKADGGTLPLEAAEREPLQSIFSGPAASAMGVVALRPRGSTSIVVDVGGTTTDLALILDGQPLFASRGGSIDSIDSLQGEMSLHLPIRAFAVRSVPVGGDSTIAVEGRHATLRTTRAGAAACLGGPEPTLTDALRILGWTTVGDAELAHRAMAQVGQATGLEKRAVAASIVEEALARIEACLEKLFLTWQREPVYRIWELKQKGHRRPGTVVGVGAAAESLVPALSERLNAQVFIPRYAPVANALGAAVARTTYTTSLHVDTEQHRFEIAEEGISQSLPSGRFTLDDAQRMAREWMARRGEALGIPHPLEDCETVLAEQFNVVEDWHTVGRIFDVRLERCCGLVDEWTH